MMAQPLDVQRALNHPADELHRFAIVWSTNEPFWRKLERSPALREKFADLKSDDLAKMAPWAIFGDVPRKRRGR